MIDGFFMK